MVSGKSIKKLKNKARQDKSDKMEVDSVDSVISNSDKESLDIAMKLMNTEVRMRMLMYSVIKKYLRSLLMHKFCLD